MNIKILKIIFLISFDNRLKSEFYHNLLLIQYIVTKLCSGFIEM